MLNLRREIELVTKYCDLEAGYKAKAIEDVKTPIFDEGELLAIRLDGVSLSRKYLKNAMHTPLFNTAMREAVTYTIEYLNREVGANSEISLAGMSCSDEASIIFTEHDNDFSHRKMKACTVVAGAFSSYFNKAFGDEALCSFDARPIILSDEYHGVEYMLHRFAVFIRNSMTKLLRLHGLDRKLLYETHYNDVLWLFQTCAEEKLLDELYRVYRGPVIQLPLAGQVRNFPTLDSAEAELGYLIDTTNLA